MLNGKSRIKKYGFWVLVIAFPISLAGSNILGLPLLLLLFLLSMIWHFSLSYFGDVLRPDSLTLLVKWDHFQDVFSVARGEISKYWKDIAVFMFAASGAIMVAVIEPQSPYGAMAGGVGWLFVVIIGWRAATRRRQNADLIVPEMPGVIGGLRALAGAIHWALTPVRPLPGGISYRFDEARDVSIAVIMGESISASRMSLFESKLDTTPKLKALSESEGLVRLFARTGVSAAVSSNASVAGFLSGSPFPWRTHGYRSLFELAKAQGFRTCYWSGQTRSPLEVLGGARFVDDVHSFESSPTAFSQRKDWVLVDKLKALGEVKRQFCFIYPRCNHAPYYGHSLQPETPLPPGEGNNWLLSNYDMGMREFDKLVVDLISELEEASSGPLFVFVMSDHNELFGEDGLKGHNLSGHPIGAFVPFILCTNQPDHPIVQTFRSAAFVDAHMVASLVMQLMGVTPEVVPAVNGSSYIGNALPFGRAGYMRLKVIDGTSAQVEHFDRSGVLQGQGIFKFPAWDRS